MCLAVYVASSVPLKEIPWNENTPSFYLKKEPTFLSAVRVQFSLPYVYYAGSHEGCGCGFWPSGSSPEELEQVRENYRQLIASLRAALQEGCKLEIFVCWEGDQTKKPETRTTLSLAEMEDPSFDFDELQFIDVKE